MSNESVVKSVVSMYTYLKGIQKLEMMLHYGFLHFPRDVLEKILPEETISKSDLDQLVKQAKVCEPGFFKYSLEEDIPYNDKVEAAERKHILDLSDVTKKMLSAKVTDPEYGEKEQEESVKKMTQR